MQPVNAAPRENILASDVWGLLQGDDVVEASYGIRWLSNALALKGDVSQYANPGSYIEFDSTSIVNASVTLYLDSDCPVDYVTDFVQPYMTLRNPDTGLSADFRLGVYTLQTPNYDNSVSPSVLTLTGYDLMYFLNQIVGDSYEALAGANPVEAAVQIVGEIFPGATVQYEPTDTVLTQDMVWPFSSTNSQITYMSIINSLLQSAGYAPVWVDWEGQFQMHPYVSATIKPYEFTMDVNDSKSVLSASRTSTQDFFDVPNYWRFVMDNQDATPVEGVNQFTYIDYAEQNPGSYPNRGRYIRKVAYVSAADYLSLVAFATQQIVKDLSPAETFQVQTSVLPLAWRDDQILYKDPNLANVPPVKTPERHTQSLRWTLPLDGSGDMSWTLQTVTQ